jgi:predicted Ser/Thr protein kinase
MGKTIDPTRIEELFHAVADLSLEDAKRVLDKECGRAPRLRAAVERLLQHERLVSSQFLKPNGPLAAEALQAREAIADATTRDENGLGGSERVGRFVLLERLGAGAMAVVYAAYDDSLDRRVALKVLQRGLALPQCLAEEARALARLTHPNVVQVYEVGEHEGQPFIAMELVPGRTLRAWLNEKPRACMAVLRVFLQAARGLAAAHDSGLVHRDFKPDNVLVGSDERVRVVDFGIAAPIGRTGESVTTMAPGTPAFMAPEQFLGAHPTAASDQFSFCVALYRALFGVPPFEGNDVPALMRNVLAGAPRVPPSAPDVPAWVTRVLNRGLARHENARFPTMGALIRAIERRMPSGPEHDPDMGRRERRLISGAMVLLGAAVLAALRVFGASMSAPVTMRRLVLIPAIALAVHALAAFLLWRRLLGNQFAQKVVAVVWLGGISVVLHRLLAIHFGQPISEVLAVDLFILGMEQMVAAALFERWFGFTAALFLGGATLAVLAPMWAVTAMLGSVIAAYALAAVRVGL